MNVLLRSASVLALSSAALAAHAQLGPVVFNARGTNGPFNTFRPAGGAPVGIFRFAAPTTIGAFGVYDALSSAGTQTFLVFNDDTKAVLFQSAPKAFAGDGGTGIGLDTYKVSDPLSFTFLPGITYAIGATASVDAGYFVALDTVTQNGVTAAAADTGYGNDNASGTTLLGRGNCCSTGVVLYGAANPTPEPAGLAVMALPLGLLGLRRRRRKG